MSHVDEIVGNRPIDKIAIVSVLEESLNEGDRFNTKSADKLRRLGLANDEALLLLAHHKSQVKYGYRLAPDTLRHILNLSEKHNTSSPLKSLIASPFLLAKTGWIYEHAPSFAFHDDYTEEELDDHILTFAEDYRSLFLDTHVLGDLGEMLHSPRRVLAATFWEKEIWDPSQMIEWARNRRLDGIEFHIDFHPFNYAKLLPEEFSEEKRREVRALARKLGMKLDLHSPIVGPYSPFPNPDRGKPLFHNPLDSWDLQRETILLARDIGGRAVVVHLVDLTTITKLAGLIMTAAGSSVRVAVENHCETARQQNADTVMSVVDEICKLLPNEVVRDNFGLTLDVGHLNIEGDDPLVGAEKIGKWSKEKGIYLRVHATGNHGRVLFSPPHYSADVHGSVSGKGINNSLIIKRLRSLGLTFDVVAEQIHPLTAKDIALVDAAQKFPLGDSSESIMERGRTRLSEAKAENLIDLETTRIEAYQFLAGLEGVDALREYLLLRGIQGKHSVSEDEARRASLEFRRMPRSLKRELVEYVEDLIAPLQDETGRIDRSRIDLVYQNLSGELFGKVSRENLDQLFRKRRVFKRGDIVFERNSKGAELYYIKQGEVSANVDGTDLAPLGDGKIFGEMGLFYDVKRPATIQVVKDNTELGILTRRGFEDILANTRPYAYDLIFRLFTLLPQRLRNLSGKYSVAVSALSHFLQKDRDGAEMVETIISESQMMSISQLKLSLDEIKGLFEQQRSFDTDEDIFAEGDPGDGVYLILDGKVRIVTLGPDFHEIVLGDLEAGHIFGEMALIDDKPRSASAVPLSPCRLVFMSRKKFEDLVQAKSGLAYRFMASVCLGIFRHIMRLSALYRRVMLAYS
jgi:CRP-like cAMP-binding protein/sugar phosphate isomerase/epimerase